MVEQAEEKPDWNLYRVEISDGNPFIVREMCDRCGKVWIPPKWRKIRACNVEDIGKVYLETGVCKDCINASVYVDKYLDGDALTEKEAKELFYKYAGKYFARTSIGPPHIAHPLKNVQRLCHSSSVIRMSGAAAMTTRHARSYSTAYL